MPSVAMPRIQSDFGSHHMADLTHESSGPLVGMRIVDLTTILLGPVATQMLGDLGADVIKVESPGGDILRGAGPPPVDDRMGALFLTNNRNKRGLVLDLKDPRGRAAMMRLLASADAFVHNMRPLAIDRLGLDYPAVSERNRTSGSPERGPSKLAAGRVAGLPPLSVSGTKPRMARSPDGTVAESRISGCAAPTPWISPPAGKTLPSVSIPSARIAMSQNADSRGRGPIEIASSRTPLACPCCPFRRAPITHQSVKALTRLRQFVGGHGIATPVKSKLYELIHPIFF